MNGTQKKSKAGKIDSLGSTLTTLKNMKSKTLLSAKYQKLAENREESQQDQNHGVASTRKAFKRY